MTRAEIQVVAERVVFAFHREFNRRPTPAEIDLMEHAILAYALRDRIAPAPTTKH